ncbi:MAG: PaaI family thioesterase [bacterium]|nr:PaaI family thioesterase [bacterium]
MTESDAVPTDASYFAAADFATFKRGFDADRLNRMLGITLCERSPGLARICLTMTPDTPQGIGGSVHGGVLASMVDIAMLAAVFADLRPGQMPAGTADLGITYLRQAHGEKIFAEAHVVKHGRQLASIEVEISDSKGTLCAKGRVLYAFRTQGAESQASPKPSERLDSSLQSQKDET